MNENIIQLNNVSKTFGNILAIDQLSLTIGHKQIYGIVGPNGSGKTTILRAILSLISIDSGNILLFNSNNLEAGKKRIGAVLEGADFYKDFPAEKNLQLVGKIKGASLHQIDTVLTTVGLVDRRKSLYKSFSLGMKQRLFIAGALLGNPQLLILDEPTNGLDPTGIIDLRKMLLALNQEGKTILIASHMLSEMEKLCTYIAILNKGKLVKSGSVDNILEEFHSLENAYIKLTG